jgi:hypothetical protein
MSQSVKDVPVHFVKDVMRLDTVFACWGDHQRACRGEESAPLHVGLATLPAQHWSDQ